MSTYATCLLFWVRQARDPMDAADAADCVELARHWANYIIAGIPLPHVVLANGTIAGYIED